MHPIVKLIVDVLMFVRPIWVAPIVLPLSWIARWIEIIQGGTFEISPKDHRARVEKLAADVRTAKANGATRLCSDRNPDAQVNTRTTGKFKRSCDARIDVSKLDRVVELNAKERYVVVQPYVTIGTLTRKLSALNLQLPVTPEMDQLTIGGLCLGYGIESSSHVHGLFFDASVLEVEVVTARGDIVVCTRTNEHEDLFRALQWSYGTLGFAVTFKLRLLPAKPFVKLTLEKIASYDEAERRSVADVSKKNAPFYYEGLAFGPTHTALIYGDVCDAVPAGAELYNPMKRWWEPFFHRYVEQKTKNATAPVTVYMPLRDYLHRYYRGLFWEVELLIPGANTDLFRFVFGWLCPPHTKHLKMLQTEEMFEQLNKDHIVQDVLVPVHQLAATLRKCDEWFDIYPLWFVFHSPPGPGDMMRPDPKDPKNGLFVDVGIWGVPARVLSGQQKDFDGEARTRDLEGFLRSVTGLQTLYATTFQTEAEFNQMFDLSHYNKMRVKYAAETTFPTIYDKVRLRRN